jgi:hypothetical protein
MRALICSILALVRSQDGSYACLMTDLGIPHRRVPSVSRTIRNTLKVSVSSAAAIANLVSFTLD